MSEISRPLTSDLYISHLACPRKARFEYTRPLPDRGPSRLVQREEFLAAAAASFLPPVGHDFRLLSLDDRVARTGEVLLTTPRPAAVLGPAFLSGSFIAEPDLLIFPEDGGFEIMELKTAASIKGSHILQLAWQTEVLSRLGLFPRKIILVHINRNFVLPPADSSGGPSSKEYHDLFKIRDVTSRVCAAAAGIGKKMEAFATDLASPGPPPPGPLCLGPDRCPYGNLCRPDHPRHHVFTLHQGSGTSRDLYERGIIELKDVPEDFRLSRKQTIQIDAVLSGKPFIDPSALTAFLAVLTYPLSFLDFETFSTAVPLYEGVTPWEHIPFAFSLHIRRDPRGGTSNFFFIADEAADPRPPFLAALAEMLPGTGSIVVYNRRFEAGIVRGLGASYPLWKPWAEAVCPRMADLLVPFQEFRYYHPDQMGRVSMKKVLPALTGKEYSGLYVENGEEANSLYGELAIAARRGPGPVPRREMVREALKEYCSLDTEGMVLILEKLFEAAKIKG
jgi:hypothetical protein